MAANPTRVFHPYLLAAPEALPSKLRPHFVSRQNAVVILHFQKLLARLSSPTRRPGFSTERLRRYTLSIYEWRTDVLIARYKRQVVAQNIHRNGQKHQHQGCPETPIAMSALPIGKSAYHFCRRVMPVLTLTHNSLFLLVSRSSAKLSVGQG
jgi:hypothetical protein